MAYKATMTSNFNMFPFDEQFVDHFWANHKTVGWGCSNKWDDVMLVQYLVNIWAKGIVLKMDGIFGNKTYKAIKSFQKWMNARTGGTVVATDGRVSAAGNSNDLTGEGNCYTIHLLNCIYLEERRIYYNDIRMDRELPNELYGILSPAT